MKTQWTENMRKADLIELCFARASIIARQQKEIEKLKKEILDLREKNKKKGE